MEAQIKDYQSIIQQHRQELVEKDKRITELQNNVASLNKKTVQLDNVIADQSAQLSRVAKIESDAHSVMNENSRLQSIAERKAQETLSALKFAEYSKKEKEDISQILQNDFSKELAHLQQVHESEKNLWQLKEKELLAELLSTAGEMKKLLTESAKFKSTITRQTSEMQQLRAVELLKIQGDTDLEETNKLVRVLETKLSQIIQQNEQLNENLNERLEETNVLKTHITGIHQEAQTKIHQLKEFIMKQEKSKEQELHQVRSEFELKLEELCQQTKELASEMAKIEIAKQQSEKQMEDNFQAKVEIEVAKAEILTEQVELLQNATAGLEKLNAEIQQNADEINEKNSILERTNARSAQIIDLQEADIRRHRLAEIQAAQNTQNITYNLNQVRKDYDLLFKVHESLAKNQTQVPYLQQQQQYHQQLHQQQQQHHQQQPRHAMRKRKEDILQQQITLINHTAINEVVSREELDENIRNEGQILLSQPRYKLPPLEGEQATSYELFGGSRQINGRNHQYQQTSQSQQLFAASYPPRDLSEAETIRQAIERHRVGNKEALISKVHDNNAYQESHRSTVSHNDRDNNRASTVQKKLFQRYECPEEHEKEEQQQQTTIATATAGSSRRKEKADQKGKTYEELQRDLKAFKNRGDTSNQMIEQLNVENEKLSQKYKDLERKYITRNDWIVDAAVEAEYLQAQESAPHKLVPLVVQRRSEKTSDHQAQIPNYNQQQQVGTASEEEYEDSEGQYGNFEQAEEDEQEVGGEEEEGEEEEEQYDYEENDGEGGQEQSQEEEDSYNF